MTTIHRHLNAAQAQRLIDEVLDPDGDAGVAAHAATCLECRALVDSFRLLGGALDRLEVPELPSDFTAQVMSRIDGAERAAARERRWALGLAASVILVAGVGVLAAGANGLGHTVSALSEQLDLAARGISVGAGVLPGLFSALRLQLLLTTTALSLLIIYGLSRLMPAARTESI